MADIAQVEVRAAVDQFQASMKAAGQAFAEVMKQMGAANQPLRDATKATDEAHQGLLGTLREFKGEQVQQGRMARFYAGELMSIVPAGDAVKGKLTELINGGLELVGKSGPLLLVVAAFEAMKFTIGAVTEHLNEVKKREEEAAKAAQEHASAVQKVVDGWRDYIREQQSEGQGGAAKKFAKDWEEAKRELDAAEVALVDIQARMADFGKSNQSEWGFKSFFQSLGFGKGALEEELAKAEAARTAAQVRVGAVQSGYETGNQVDQTKANEELHRQRLEIEAKYAAEEVKVRDEAERQKLELKKKYGGLGTAELQKALDAIDRNSGEEIARIQRERQEKHAAFMESTQSVTEEQKIRSEAGRQVSEILSRLRRGSTAEEKQLAAEEIAAVSLAADRKIAIYQAEQRERLRLADEAREREEADLNATIMLWDQQAQEKIRLQVGRATAIDKMGGNVSNGNRLAQLREEMQQEINAYRQAAQQREQTEADTDAGIARIRAFYRQQEGQLMAKDNSEQIRIAEQLGAAFGNVFSSISGGTKAVVQAFVQMAQQVVQIITQMAIKAVIAHAAEAGAGAAASQSAIPIIGPVLAISAMGAMVAAVMSLLGNLTSSSGGYEVPGNVSSALGVLHPRETVLPADLSDGFKQIIRGGGAGGGGGGDTYHITLGPNLDAKSLRDYLSTGDGATGLVQAIGILKKSGRLS